MSEFPRFWSSWKGHVVGAVCINGASTWEEVKNETGLPPKSLNRALAELFELELISKNGDEEYRVEYSLYKEYVDYAKKQHKVDESTVPVSKHHDSKLKKRVEEWLEFKSLSCSLENMHFYVDGAHLDELAKDLVENCEREVMVVNPFVDRCNLTESLIKASEKSNVSLITRSPLETRRHAKKRRYHKTIKDSSIDLYYNNVVHAKLIIVDKTVALVSSMNLYSGSTAGASWEAGIVTIDNSVINQIIQSIQDLITRKETAKQ